jgi:hypothetical protein
MNTIEIVNQEELGAKNQEEDEHDQNYKPRGTKS